MFDGFCVLCYDKLDFNLDKGDMEVQNLVHQKDNFLGLERENREKFFSAPSGYAEFSNSQLFFYMFSIQGKYKLYHDGEFSRMCVGGYGKVFGERALFRAYGKFKPIACA